MKPVLGKNRLCSVGVQQAAQNLQDILGEMVMKLTCFLRLCEQQQLELLYHHGVYIGKRWLGPYPVLLFQLEGFYVEVFYRRYRKEVEHIRCFADTDQLLPYLAQVDVQLSV